MEIKIYADILFLLNLMFDFCLLSFAASLLHIKPALYRLIASSAIGAIYSLAAFFATSDFISGWLFKTTTAAVMTGLAFGIKNLRTFLKRLCIFYLTAIAMGGICFATLSASGIGSRLGAVYSGGILYINLPAYKLILAGIILYFIMRIAVSAAEKIAFKTSAICRIRLNAFDVSLVLPAFYDTGNFLSDPKTALGACVAEWSAVMPFFPDCESVEAAAKNYPERFNSITCKVIGGNTQLYAFYADISSGKENNAEHRLIAITPQSLTNDKKYSLILPNDFKGANINDGTSFKGHFKHCKNNIFTA